MMLYFLSSSQRGYPQLKDIEMTISIRYFENKIMTQFSSENEIEAAAGSSLDENEREFQDIFTFSFFQDFSRCGNLFFRFPGAWEP